MGELKLAKKVMFVSKPNAMASRTKINGDKVPICQFDDEGRYETDDAVIAAQLKLKGIPYKVVDTDKPKDAPFK